jgi:APA family basic amino acid/polyamine antiporter
MELTTGTGAAADAAPRPKLKRSLGLSMATALVVGNMVGSGVFLLPASLAGEAGPVSIFAVLLTGVGAMLLAGVFATLGSAYPRTGGPYAYTGKAFGDFAGFLTAGIPVYVWMKWRQRQEEPEVVVPEYPPDEAHKPLVVH